MVITCRYLIAAENMDIIKNMMSVIKMIRKRFVVPVPNVTEMIGKSSAKSS